MASLGSIVKEHAKKLKNTVEHIRLEPVLNKDGEHGGFMLTHHMHDYQHPLHGVAHHMKTHGEVAKHLKECPACSGTINEMGSAKGRKASGATIESAEDEE